jgi:hypothetical protein
MSAAAQREQISREMVGISFEFALFFEHLTYILHNNVDNVIVQKQC